MISESRKRKKIISDHNLQISLVCRLFLIELYYNLNFHFTNLKSNNQGYGLGRSNTQELKSIQNV